MQNRNRFTVLSLLEANRTGRTITRPKPARWSRRRNTALSDRLLTTAVQWPSALTGPYSKNLVRTSV